MVETFPVRAVSPPLLSLSLLPQAAKLRASTAASTKQITFFIFENLLSFVMDICLLLWIHSKTPMLSPKERSCKIYIKFFKLPNSPPKRPPCARGADGEVGSSTACNISVGAGFYPALFPLKIKKPPATAEGQNLIFPILTQTPPAPAPCTPPYPRRWTAAHPPSTGAVPSPPLGR